MYLLGALVGPDDETDNSALLASYELSGAVSASRLSERWQTSLRRGPLEPAGIKGSWERLFVVVDRADHSCTVIASRHLRHPMLTVFVGAVDHEPVWVVAGYDGIPVFVEGYGIIW